MISYKNMGWEMMGLSTDTKPFDGVPNGSTFYEIDTGKTLYFRYDEGWYDKDASAHLTSIAVSTQPTKKSYTAGESFNPAGMVITATYGTGGSATTKTVTTDCEILIANPLTTSDTTVTIVFRDTGLKKTTTQSITVTAAS